MKTPTKLTAYPYTLVFTFYNLLCLSLTGTTPTPPVSAPTPTPVYVQPTPPPVPTTSTKSHVNYQKDIQDIHNKLNQIANLKSELKQQLSQTEKFLDNARKKTIESKKISFEIIQKTSVSDAENLVAQVNTDLQNLKNTKKNLQTIIVPKFASNIKKIEDTVKEIQSKINVLQAKGLQFQISQAQLQLQKQLTQAKTDTVDTTPPTKITEEKTFLQKIYNNITNYTTQGLNLIKKGLLKIKKRAYSSKQDNKLKDQKI